MREPATIVVNNVWSRLKGLKDVELADMLDRQTSYYVEGYQYTRAFTQGVWDKHEGRWKRWDGKRHLLNSRMVFPTGLLGRVEKFLRFHDIPYKLEDKRPAPGTVPLELSARTPRPYQSEALQAALDAERGIIRIGTGGGKTFVAAMLAARYNLPTMIYVVGKDLLHQFHEEMALCFGEDQVGIIGDGLCSISKFNVCSVWTAAKAFGLKSKVSLDDEDWAPEVLSLDSARKQAIKGAIQSARLAIFDEAHFLACDTIQSIFKAGTSCRYMFGLTGTDWRDDGADLLLESVCGGRIYNMPASRLIEDGYLVQPKIAMLEVPPDPEIPKKALWPEVYSRYITNSEVRNGMIVDSVRQLLKMGRKTLVLVRYLKHGRNLVDMLGDERIYFVSGELDAEGRIEIKRRFEAGEIRAIVASSVFDIGVDIPSIDGLVLAGGGKSTVRALQRIGRAIRLCEGKEDALVVDFIDNARYLDKHSATRIAVYETEPAFRLKLPQGFDRGRLKKVRKVKEKVR